MFGAHALHLAASRPASDRHFPTPRTTFQGFSILNENFLAYSSCDGFRPGQLYNAAVPAGLSEESRGFLVPDGFTDGPAIIQRFPRA